MATRRKSSIEFNPFGPQAIDNLRAVTPSKPYNFKAKPKGCSFCESCRSYKENQGVKTSKGWKCLQCRG